MTAQPLQPAPVYRLLTAFATALVCLGLAAGCPGETVVDNDNDEELDAGDEDVDDDGDPDADEPDDTDQPDDADEPDAGEDADDNGGDTGDVGEDTADTDPADDAGDVGEDDAGDEFVPSEGMAHVPEGTYRRGCDPDLDDCSILGTEEPAHEVFVSGFEIDIHPVTESEYAECVNDAACTEAHYDGDESGDDYPVVNVTSDQAMDYCQWVDKRLPTEAEWEKAARGTDERIYPWGDDDPSCTLANYDDCGEEIQPVGETPDGASPYGVEEMAGNVRNWAYDWFDGDYYEDSPSEDPMGPDSGDTRAVRGASWFWGESSLRAATRHSMETPGYSHETGFRCARPIED